MKPKSAGPTAPARMAHCVS